MMPTCIHIENDERAEFYSDKTVTARKSHKCGECGDEIKPGSTYERVFMVFEGHPEIHKTCQVCLNVRNSLFENEWTFGRIWDDIREAFEYDDDDEDGDDWSWLK